LAQVHSTTQEAVMMNTPAKPELEQLIETFRAVTEEDVTEPLLADMRVLTDMIERKCSALSTPATTPPIIAAR